MRRTKKTKAKKPKKTHTRRRGGGPKGKRVAFGEPQEMEFETPIQELVMDASESRVRKCPSITHIRPEHFPCRYKNTVFADRNEFLVWYKDELNRRAAVASPSYKTHLKRRVATETGKWDTYVPHEFRAYNDLTGTIEDVRPFGAAEQESSRALLIQRRKERKDAQEQWRREVQEFRKQLQAEAQKRASEKALSEAAADAKGNLLMEIY